MSSIDFNNGSDSSNLNNGSETSESDLEPMDSIELEMIKIHEGYVDENENKIVHNCLVILENKNQQQIDTLLRDHFNVEEYNKYFNASRDVIL